MAGMQYGNFSPREDDPYPIETMLAEKSATSPVLAQSMLDLYRTQRETSLGNYNVGLEQQHEFARQQLAAQIANNNAERLKGFMDVPGGIDLIKSLPGYNGMLSGADPTALAQFSDPQRRLQNATIAEKGGAGVYSLANAGFAPSNAEASRITNLQTSPSVPLATQAAAARAHETKPEHYQLPIKLGELPDGTPINMNVPISMGASQAEIEARIADAKRSGQTAYPPKGNVSDINTTNAGGSNAPNKTPLQPMNAVGGNRQGPHIDESGKVTVPLDASNPNPLLGGLTTDAPAPMRAPTTPRTNLPMAQTDTRAGGAQAAPPPPPQAQTQAQPKPVGTDVVLDPKIQAKARDALKLMPRDVQLDVLANTSRSGIFPVMPADNGKLGFLGKSGFYLLPERGQ